LAAACGQTSDHLAQMGRQLKLIVVSPGDQFIPWDSQGGHTFPEYRQISCNRVPVLKPSWKWLPLTATTSA